MIPIERHQRILALVEQRGAVSINELTEILGVGTVAKLAMRQPFVLFKGLTFQKLCLPGAFRPGDHHN
ncbi:DeoR family transcriptional regulator, partial [Klebsiella pneumoniae]|nr:DeoR family transcriptional regulator [Klebsiella pneumoniae]